MNAVLHENLFSVIFPASLVLILLASEIGGALGMRARSPDGANFPTLQTAIFGLLALMIGFTFSMALSRFEARREAVLMEANTIATVALRARLLPAPHDAECLKLLRQYVKLRIELSQFPSPSMLNAGIAQSNALQEELWQQATAGVSKEPNSSLPTWSIFQALNDMFNSQQKRLAVLRNQIPGEVLITLYAIAMVASGFAGYAAVQSARSSRIPGYITGMLICVVMFLIQDLEASSTGLISVSQEPVIETAEAIAVH